MPFLMKHLPSNQVECLVSDFKGDEQAVKQLATSGVDVYSHNVEIVRTR